ncbi:hypothetical protein E4U10_002713 [Claviceps purpurea]|nr:hypothetical protein E4U10_002713 [Claviceps purpurea]
MRLQHHLVVGLSASASASNYTFPYFDWDSLHPTKDLEYHDCYTSHKCALLALPLDWKNTSDPRTVSIAIIKLPARVPDTDAAFGGPVITNPGGPGGSGVDLVLGSGRYLQKYIDTPGKKHHEIVSFDPRGVGRSRPRANCFPDTALARDAMILEARGLGSLSHDAGKLAYGLAMMDGFAKRCAVVEDRHQEAGEEIFSYMGTPSVARDMIEMVDKMDELRKKQSNRDDGDERLELKKRGRREGNVVKLQYLGFSYGTVLGNYVASLFPERVGRVVLDGVCNADDYSNGGGWLTNTVDADAVITNFFTGCFQAGRPTCALARPSDKSPSDITTRFRTWLSSLDASPLAGLSSSGNPVILTGADIRLLLSTAAYKPLSSFKPLAQLLNTTMQGQGLPLLFSTLESTLLGGPLQNACPILTNDTTTPTPAPAVADTGSDALTAIVCGDGEDLTSKTLPWWQSYIDHQKNTSSVFGAYWSQIRFSCARWPFRANWIFRGPFTTPSPPSAAAAAALTTSVGAAALGAAAPLLFLSNRLDPVTPLSAARAMARRHPGAGLVVQEALGHCAIAAAYSSCTRDIVAEYFLTGRVPGEGERSCEAECGAWDVGCEARMMGGKDGGDGRDGRDGGEEWFERNVRRFPLGV